ncbi:MULTISPECIES: AAA family ATPase [Halomonas]|uniref:ATPase family associated with various cellular activities (AAA) n=1 Tax=Halomonas chromatireducens TaxID=507626 RepID=A0A0X8HB36_9GAMM|nr:MULTISPECIES: MoxR family ATPase [Halomonas]AMC99369.1 ATPase family associated with various cellular activities (AAA) [Halomonas chromatireducens]MBZ0331123.1 MoxR family ATPase [Halomonas sp. ANAO-440]
MNALAAAQSLEAIAATLDRVVLGKSREVRLALCCLLCRGHLLIEDLPGLGKTTLAQALARVTGLDMQRLQFTSDLLPADVLGVSVFDPREASFRFHPGPIFHGLVLADEINRATPKTQSALLEAMEEGQVTVEGETRALPDPFFVIATQNPQDQAGTFALPESQLDRFLMRLSLGYPDFRAERDILRGLAGRTRLDDLSVLLDGESLRHWQAKVATIHVSDRVLDYVQSLGRASREHPELAWGLSTRGLLALVQAARGWALLAGRDHVLPEDVQAVWVPVAGHRLSSGHREEGEALAAHLLGRVPVAA